MKLHIDCQSAHSGSPLEGCISEVTEIAENELDGELALIERRVLGLEVAELSVTADFCGEAESVVVAFRGGLYSRKENFSG